MATQLWSLSDMNLLQVAGLREACFSMMNNQKEPAHDLYKDTNAMKRLLFTSLSL